MKKLNKDNLKRLAHSNFDEDELDEWYDTQLIEDRKQRNREKARHGFKEENENY
jgi:hypothetical protein